MTKKDKKNHGRERRLSVRSARRSGPDMRRLARVLIDYALAEAEAKAVAEQQIGTTPTAPGKDAA